MADWHVRRAAFDWLTEQVAIHGAVSPRQLLAAGFRLTESGFRSSALRAYSNRRS
jgi:hypothetical protein